MRSTFPFPPTLIKIHKSKSKQQKSYSTPRWFTSYVQSIIHQYETEMKFDNWKPHLEMQINYQKKLAKNIATIWLLIVI